MLVTIVGASQDGACSPHVWSENRPTFAPVCTAADFQQSRIQHCMLLQACSNHNLCLLKSVHGSCGFVPACITNVVLAFLQSQIRAMAVSDDGQLIFVAEMYLARQDNDEDQVDFLYSLCTLPTDYFHSLISQGHLMAMTLHSPLLFTEFCDIEKRSDNCAPARKKCACFQAPECTVLWQIIRVVDARSGYIRLLTATAKAPLIFSNVAALHQTATAAAACDGKCGQVTDLLVLSTKPNWIGGADGTAPISWVLHRQGQGREAREAEEGKD
jgi:hypothetical protein